MQSTATKIMIISRNIPPRYSGTSVVIENLSQGFSSDQLLIIGEKYLGVKSKISNSFKRKVKYNTISFKTNRIVTNILRKAQILSGLLILIYHILRFKPNKIIIIYPSAEYLLMGYLISKIYSCDYYTYFHNTYLENRISYKRLIAKWLQLKMFNLSEIIFVISGGMHEYYLRNYSNFKNKFEVLTHSFTEEVPQKVDVKIDSNIKLAFAGNINESCRDAAERLFRKLAKFRNIEFHMFTSDLSLKFLMSLGIKKDFLKQYPLLDRSLFLHKLREMDIMLLPHGLSGKLPQVEYNTIFPTKTIEYLISGKPIFYLGPSTSYLTHFLEQNYCACVTHEKNELEIEDKFTYLINHEIERKLLVENAIRAAQKFQLQYILDRLKTTINF